MRKSSSRPRQRPDAGAGNRSARGSDHHLGAGVGARPRGAQSRPPGRDRQLAGTPLDREHLSELAARIEAEQPRFVAAVRAARTGRRRPRRLRRRAHPRPDREANINARYIVESVEIRGVPEGDVSQQLRDDLQALVGRRLDSDEAERLEDAAGGGAPRLRRQATHRAREPAGPDPRSSSTCAGRESARWLHFEPLKSKFVYHSDQGWGGYLDLPHRRPRRPCRRRASPSTTATI